MHSSAVNGHAKAGQKAPGPAAEAELVGAGAAAAGVRVSALSDSEAEPGSRAGAELRGSGYAACVALWGILLVHQGLQIDLPECL